MKKKAIIVSGYFNPLHKGHIEYFHKAKLHGEALFVIINNDLQRELKGSKEFMNQDERMLLVNELKIVDKVILSIDSDSSVCSTIEKIYKQYSDQYQIFFANGGDQTNSSIPELSICKQYGIGLIDGLGEKIQSSSWILKKRK
ncbi:MAG: adenylyltransferase/cytidyltransferase family protein [Bacteroidota bacterium]|nr:adenylyltransferase/cytidyltransferase family protein [Bacteroidota bacterium]